MNNLTTMNRQRPKSSVNPRMYSPPIAHEEEKSPAKKNVLRVETPNYVYETYKIEKSPII